jgi:hypothetical protein
MLTVRLTELEINQIIDAFKAVFFHSDKLWIFGSRIDDAAKGGDLDLYIECSLTEPDKIRDMKMDFHYLLIQKLGDQKIDIIIKFGDYHLPIYEIARKEGMRLV